MNEWINHKAVCRTALATPSLLNNCILCHMIPYINIWQSQANSRFIYFQEARLEEWHKHRREEENGAISDPNVSQLILLACNSYYDDIVKLVFSCSFQYRMEQNSKSNLLFWKCLNNLFNHPSIVLVKMGIIVYLIVCVYFR